MNGSLVAEGGPVCRCCRHGPKVWSRRYLTHHSNLHSRRWIQRPTCPRLHGLAPIRFFLLHLQACVERSIHREWEVHVWRWFILLLWGCFGCAEGGSWAGMVVFDGLVGDARWLSAYCRCCLANDEEAVRINDCNILFFSYYNIYVILRVKNWDLEIQVWIVREKKERGNFPCLLVWLKKKTYFPTRWKFLSQLFLNKKCKKMI